MINEKWHEVNVKMHLETYRGCLLWKPKDLPVFMTIGSLAAETVFGPLEFSL